MTQINFVVPGVPVAKGRPKFRKAGKFIQTYTPTKTQKAEKFIADCFKAYGKKPPKKYDEIWLTCNFYMSIPKGTSKKRTLEWNEKKGHTKRPDVDNLVKTVCDALNGVAFVDDSLITGMDVCKLYSTNPRTEIAISYHKSLDK